MEKINKKVLFEVGDIPPLGYIPLNMYAWTLKKDNHGKPTDSFVIAVVPTPQMKDNEVLVYVMAAGVNFNGVWAALGDPVSVFDIHEEEIHIAGSDASGIVWGVGKNVTRWNVGDEVVIHCNQIEGVDEHILGGDPMLSPTQKIWGYETPNGAFAQFTNVQEQQLLKKPPHISWGESASYMLSLATVYRMLTGHTPHTISPGDNILIWGAAGGLGSAAIQLCKVFNANAIAVVSSEDKAEYVLSLGAAGVINRKDFDCWDNAPKVNSPEYASWIKEVQKFGKAIWAITGKGNPVDIVLEHPGESTFPVSCYVVKPGGMVVFCAGTSGFDFKFDARYVWMKQKRIQGSHFAHLSQAKKVNDLVLNRLLEPPFSKAYEWEELPLAHELMLENQHLSGNMSIRVGCSSL